MRRIGEAERADPAVAPGLPHQPGERIEAVLGFAEIFREAALRPVAAAAILIDDGITVADEIAGDLGARARCGDGGGALGAARGGFAVWGAFEQDRKRPAGARPVDVGRQPDAVARRHQQIALDDHLMSSRRIHAISSRKGSALSGQPPPQQSVAYTKAARIYNANWTIAIPALPRRGSAVSAVLQEIISEGLLLYRRISSTPAARRAKEQRHNQRRPVCSLRKAQSPRIVRLRAPAKAFEEI